MTELASDFNPQRADAGLSMLLADFPPSLFSDRLYESIELVDRYCLELAADVLNRLAVPQHLGEWRSAKALVQHLGFTPRFGVPLAWLLDRVAAPR